MEEEQYTFPPASELYAKCFSFLSQEVIGEKYIKKLQDFVQLLPPEFTLPNVPVRILECPLTGRENWGDISFWFHGLKSPFHDICALPKSWQACPAWKQVSYFSKACIENNLLSDSLKGVNPFFWLEFDVGSSLCDRPNLFLQIDQVKKKNFTSFIQSCVPFFNIPDATVMLLQKCSDALFKGLYIRHIGFMLSRPGHTCKLQVCGKDLNSHNLEHYLLQIGAYNAHSQLLSILKILRDHVDYIGLNFDLIDHKISPKMGLDLVITPRSHKEEQKLWEQCFDLIRAQCPINWDKLSKCFDWEGGEREFIGNSSALPHFFLVSQRKVKYFKFVFIPNEPVQVKVYLITNWAVEKKEEEQDLFERLLSQ